MLLATEANCPAQTAPTVRGAIVLRLAPKASARSTFPAEPRTYGSPLYGYSVPMAGYGEDKEDEKDHSCVVVILRRPAPSPALQLCEQRLYSADRGVALARRRGQSFLLWCRQSPRRRRRSRLGRAEHRRDSGLLPR